MKRYVSPNSLCRDFKRLRIWAWTETSREEVGSSRTRRSGLVTSALATAILCPLFSAELVGKPKEVVRVKSHPLDQALRRLLAFSPARHKPLDSHHLLDAFAKRLTR